MGHTNNYKQGRGVIGKKLYIDGSAYVSFYRYFLGYHIGVTLLEIGGVKLPNQVYRVAANSPDRIPASAMNEVCTAEHVRESRGFFRMCF